MQNMERKLALDFIAKSRASIAVLPSSRHREIALETLKGYEDGWSGLEIAESDAVAASETFWGLIDEAVALPAKRAHEAACKASVGTLLQFKECFEQAGRVNEALTHDLARMN